jgi:chemotaxis family two-component system response regulator Rcp1
LVLLSLKLPGMEGRALLAEIKSDPALRTIPALVFTSSSAPGDIDQSYELWANCYIVKPVDLAAFFQVIQGIGEF